MHSLQSLREIREMEYFLYGGLSRAEFFANPRHSLEPPQGGKVVAVVVYNLRTREITIRGALSPLES